MADAQEFQRIQAALEKAVMGLEAIPVPYAIIGGFAVRYHGYRRYTNDIDILLHQPGYVQVLKNWVGNGYKTTDKPSEIWDEENQTRIDLCISDNTERWPAIRQNTKKIDGVNIIRLTKLIDMKLAAGRHRDLGDVVELVKANQLEREFVRGISGDLHEAWHEIYDRIESGEE